MFSTVLAREPIDPLHENNAEENQPDQHVNGVEPREQEVGTGPHVSAGDIHWQHGMIDRRSYHAPVP